MVGLRVSLPVAAVLAVFLSSTAFGANTIVNGSLCNPHTPADSDRITRDQFGARNESTTATAKVQCAVPKDVSEVVDNVFVRVYDRHTTENVCCTFAAQSLTG